MTVERENAFDLIGPKTLIGPELKAGDPAPDFSLLNSKLQPVTKEQYAGKPLVLSVVPSLDTPVCSLQTVRFNEEAGKLGDKITIVTVSADLPFAQARWCGDHNVENVQTLSDHRDMSFGDAYGTHVKEVRIESRAVFVVDKDGTIQYAEYVPKAGEHPNYDAVLEALKPLV